MVAQDDSAQALRSRSASAGGPAGGQGPFDPAPAVHHGRFLPVGPIRAAPLKGRGNLAPPLFRKLIEERAEPQAVVAPVVVDQPARRVAPADRPAPAASRRRTAGPAQRIGSRSPGRSAPFRCPYTSERFPGFCGPVPSATTRLRRTAYARSVADSAVALGHGDPIWHVVQHDVAGRAALRADAEDAVAHERQPSAVAPVEVMRFPGRSGRRTAKSAAACPP